MLGPLQHHGGPTLTQALLPGSPPIDAGDPNFTPPPFYDQRGPRFVRVSNARLDVGSFETQPEPPPSPTPDRAQLQRHGELRSAVESVAGALMKSFLSAWFRGFAVVRAWAAAFRSLSQSSKLLLQFLEIVIRELFQVDELIARTFHGAD